MVYNCDRYRWRKGATRAIRATRATGAAGATGATFDPRGRGKLVYLERFSEHVGKNSSTLGFNQANLRFFAQTKQIEHVFKCNLSIKRLNVANE